jgi:hypothetical protein
LNSEYAHAFNGDQRSISSVVIGAG